MHTSFLLGCAMALLATSAAAQAQPPTCHCPQNLAQLVAQTEANYAGYPTKVNTRTRPAYQALLSSLRAKAARADGARACFFVLKEYIRFFYDKHFNLLYTDEPKEPLETTPVPADQWRSELASAAASSMAGIWINADSTLQLAVREAGKQVMKGTVLWSADSSLRPGTTYFTLTRSGGGWIAKEYQELMTTDVPAAKRGQLLYIWNHAVFARQYPVQAPAADREVLRSWRQGNQGLAFRQLSARTAYLRIPSFLNNDDKIQQLVAAHDAAIRHSEYLIIDLRGNAGGNTGWVPLLPYLMTNPIRQYPTYVRVTPANVQAKRADLAFFATNPILEEYKKYFPDSTLAAYKRAYAELPTTTQAFYPVPGVSFPLDSVLVRPRRVAVLVDEWCGSSAEYFFSLMSQSKKVTTYGAPTVGMMDYEGMSTPTPLPYPGFLLVIPIAKSNWTDSRPIDKTGFRPQVLLTHLADRQQWIEVVKKELEKQ